MKNNTLSQLSDAELNKQKNLLTGVLIGLAVVMLVASGIILYVIIKHKNLALVATIPCTFITLLPSFIRLGQINTEIKSRNAKLTTP
ncbi:hypothetical protein [Pedobacter rhizosphaerae]|uniref:Redox-active disulfide protein 2 n=1 Tax=Pedobacter rhizosphaerae TaxID=390241 RepID=A0A1H9W7D5_9SPHI|nr:hypothetical protein [Pedobacter rhizosphaerae]SES29822.1 hypothetical protein SAMN04488023_1617 [Pedobacter rhizosphaerae]